MCTCVGVTMVVRAGAGVVIRNIAHSGGSLGALEEGADTGGQFLIFRENNPKIQKYFFKFLFSRIYTFHHEFLGFVFK